MKKIAWHEEEGDSKQINGVRNFFLIKIHNVIAIARSCINNSTIHFLCIKYLTREKAPMMIMAAKAVAAAVVPGARAGAGDSGDEDNDEKRMY